MHVTDEDIYDAARSWFEAGYSRDTVVEKVRATSTEHVMLVDAAMTDLAREVQQTRVVEDVRAERDRQDEKFGDQSHLPDGTGLPGDAEMAERAKALCAKSAADGFLTWRGILAEEVLEACAESDPAKLRAELIQVAAVAVAWAEAIDRRNTNPTE